MADANPLQQGFEKVRSILESLKAAAQPRSDILSPPSTPTPTIQAVARPYTYAGRVGNALDKETPESILARVPIAELETGGRALTSPADLLGAVSLGKGIYTLAGTAFHGSPYRFDKFDPSKIGTGEGAQVYGHGLYFAENPLTARSYQKAQDPSEQMVLNMFMNRKAAGLSDEVAKQQTIEWATRNPQLGKEVAEKAFKNSSFYQVEIPDQHIKKMLDWDKPLSEQPENVKQIIPKILEQAKKSFPEANFAKRDIMADNTVMTGRQLYEVYSQHRGNPQAASEELKKLGIPGIKYLDQGSRGYRIEKSQGGYGDWLLLNSAGQIVAKDKSKNVVEEALRKKETNNYVVFDPAILTETKRIE